MSDEEIPTVIGRRVTSAAEIDALPNPKAGDLRTAVHLESARRLAASGKAPVLGGLIGPFSLAGRIFGVSEALEATVADPELILSLLEKVTDFLVGYSRAFREAGAMGVIMAEPAAGLLSPRGLARFSAPFVNRILSEGSNRGFQRDPAQLRRENRPFPQGAGIGRFPVPFRPAHGYRGGAAAGRRQGHPGGQSRPERHIPRRHARVGVCRHRGPGKSGQALSQFHHVLRLRPAPRHPDPQPRSLLPGSQRQPDLFCTPQPIT